MNRNKPLVVLSVIASVSLTFSYTHAQAEEVPKYKELMNMNLGDMLKVNVATGTPKQLSEAPAVVSVITAEDIKATGALTLDQALRGVPGFSFGHSMSGDQLHYNIRGIATAYNPQILILMDGVDIRHAYSSAPTFTFNYPVSAIERIEVIRGPGSAVYGADAYSGVVNIITKKATATEYAIGGSYGSFDTKELWTNVHYVKEDFSLSLAVNHSETQDDSDRTIKGAPLNYNRNIDNIHFDLSYGDFSLENWYQQNRTDLGVSVGIWVNDEDKTEYSNQHTKLAYISELSDHLSVDASVYYRRAEYLSQLILFPADTYGIGADGNFNPFSSTQVEFPSGIIGNPGADSKTLEFDTAFIYSLNNHRLRIAVGASDTELTTQESKNFGPGILDTANVKPVSDTVIDVTGTDYVFAPDYDRQLWYVSLQDEWKFAEHWEFTAGLRFDNYSDFGSTTNPRVALVWATNESLTTKFLYGSAFRAPSILELTTQNNPIALGNSELSPETIDTTEIAFDYHPTKSLNLLLNIFHYQAEDIMSLMPDVNSPGESRYQNALSQTGQGIEAEAKWQVTEQLSLNANVSWLQAEDGDNGNDKALVPSKMANIDLRYRISNQLMATLQTYWVADIQREFCDLGEPAFNEAGIDCANTTPRAPVDDYLLTDINVIYEVANQWRVGLNVKNLFDEDYSLPTPSNGLFLLGFGYPNDIPMRGRAINANVSYQF